MLKLIAMAVGFVMKLLGRAPSTQEQLGQAKAAAQSQENARAEVSQAVDARRAADADRLRNAGAGPVTTDPAAPINDDDGFERH